MLQRTQHVAKAHTPAYHAAAAAPRLPIYAMLRTADSDGAGCLAPARILPGSLSLGLSSSPVVNMPCFIHHLYMNNMPRPSETPCPFDHVHLSYDVMTA